MWFLNFLHKTDFVDQTNIVEFMNVYSSNNDQILLYYIIILLLIILLYLCYIIYYKTKINNSLKSKNDQFKSDIDLLSSNKYEDMVERYKKLKYNINMNNLNKNKPEIYSIAYYDWLQDHKNMMNFVDNKLIIYKNININKISYEEFVERCVVIHEIHYFWVKKHRDMYDNFLLRIESNNNSLVNNDYPNDEIVKFKNF